MCLPGPVILQIGAFQLRWYGLLAAIALLVSYAFLMARVKKTSIKADDVTTLLTLCVLLGIAGARIEYVRRFWGTYFSQNPLAVFRIWEGGLVFQGGFILALLGALLLCKIKHWSIGDMGDLFAPVLPVGHAIARIGCLLNGCCFGMPWRHFGAVQYPATGNDVLNTQIFLEQIKNDAQTPLPVLPIQAIEALWCLAVAALILLCEKRGFLGKYRFFIYVMGYSIGRFFLEFFRGDYHQTSGLTPAQWTTVLIIIPVTIAVFAISFWFNRRHTAK